MRPLRLSSDLRRELILSAAKRCFARHGFAGCLARMQRDVVMPQTQREAVGIAKSVAAAASISEGLLFKHFPTKSALYEEILAEACEADPAFEKLLQRPPSTETLAILVRGMVGHFLQVAEHPDQQEVQRLRLTVSSQLDDGEFARLLYGKVGDLIGPVFEASLKQAIACKDATRIGLSPLNLFWFAHHTVLMSVLAQLPSPHCLDYGKRRDYERQMCEFILRGIGLTDCAIAAHLDREMPPELMQPTVSDAQPSESA